MIGFVNPRAFVPYEAESVRSRPRGYAPIGTAGDGRVAGIRGPAVDSGAAAAPFEQVIVGGQPGASAMGPATFIRSASRA